MQKPIYVGVTVRLTKEQLKALDQARVLSVPPPTRQGLIRQMIDELPKESRA